MSSPNNLVPSASSIMKKNKEKMARENHSEIERRRRNKMNHYMKELSTIIPGIVNQKKVDKLSILKATVQYIHLLRDYSEPPTMVSSNVAGAETGVSASDPNQTTPSLDNHISFLTSREFRQVLMESANGFMFVYSTTTKRILYMGDVVGIILGHKKELLEGKSIYDCVHPNDHFKLNANFMKMNDQLESNSVLGNSIEVNPSESSMPARSTPSDYFPRTDITLRFECGHIDDFYGLDSIYPSSLCLNVKRFCLSQRFKDFDQSQILRDYVVAHCCTSLMKFSDVGFKRAQHSQLFEGESPSGLCVVAVAYIPPNNMNYGDPPIGPKDTLTQPSDSKLIFQLNQQGSIIFVQKPNDSQFSDLIPAPEKLCETPIFPLIHESDQEVFVNSFKKLLENYKKINNITLIVKLKLSGLLIKTFITLELISNAYNESIECILMHCENMKEQINSTSVFKSSFVGHHPLKRSLDLEINPRNHQSQQSQASYPSSVTNTTMHPGQFAGVSTTASTSSNATATAATTTTLGPEYFLLPDVQSIPLIAGTTLPHQASNSMSTNPNCNQLSQLQQQPPPQAYNQQFSGSFDLSLSNSSINNAATGPSELCRPATGDFDNYPTQNNPLGYIWNVFNVQDPQSNKNPQSAYPFTNLKDEPRMALANPNQMFSYADPNNTINQTNALQSDQNFTNNNGKMEESHHAPYLDEPTTPTNYVPSHSVSNIQAVNYFNQFYPVDSNNNSSIGTPNNDELFSMLAKSGYNPNANNQPKRTQ